jgi:hypothetical protein
MPAKAVFDVARAAALHADGMPLAQVSKLPGMPCPATLKTHLLECGYEVWKGPWKMRMATKEQLYELHHVKSMSSAAIARLYGCAQQTAYRRLRHFGIARKQGTAPKRRGPDNPNWRGGRYVNNRGYVFVYKPHHPQAMQNGYVAEHRMVAADSLGEQLSAAEEVHHVNGNKLDNRRDNLIVVRNGLHQRLHAEVLRELWALRHEVARLGGQRSGDGWRVVG